MVDRSASRWQRRRTLSEDVRRRCAITLTEAARQDPLPWASPRSRSGTEKAETRPTDGQVIQRAVQDNVQRAVQDDVPPSDEAAEQGEAAASTRPSPQQVADRVYQLMCEDLRLERERKG
jgi:hypothetical protein